MFSFLAAKPKPTEPEGPGISTPWADEPLKLMPTIASYRDIKEHVALHMANEMVLVHNAFFRAFNAVLLQGPHLPSYSTSSPTRPFSPRLIKSFLFFTISIIHTLEHHHGAEETAGFPVFERELGMPGLMSVAVEQHAAFHDGLDELEAYCEKGMKEPQTWEWKEMKRILDGFLPALEMHLREEIEVFLAMEKLEDQGAMRKGWDAMEKKAVEAGLGALYDLFPIVFSCHDRTYENSLHASFPPIPAPMKYAVAYWTSRTYADSWRFGPCDMWSRPRPLMFLGGEDQPKE